MGATLHCETFDGKLTQAEIRAAYAARRSEMTIEHGTDAYNGTWSTLDGSIEFPNKTFEAHLAAENFISETAIKWCAAIAVKFKDNRTETRAQPTFEGKPYALSSGAHLMFRRFPADDLYTTRAVISQTVARMSTTAPYIFVAADQLSLSGKGQLIAACRTYMAARDEFEAALRPVTAFIQKLSDPRQEIETAAFAAFKKQRKQAVKLAKIRDKMAERLYELDNRVAEKLYKTETVDHGQLWLVGGLCAM